MAVLTISRQFGAGGKTLGDLVSKKLGYTLIDKEIISLVAEKARVSENWVEAMEDDAGDTLLNFFSKLVSKSFYERVLDDTRGYIDEEIYIKILRDVISQLAKEDNCIILGRGGQYILSDAENTYHLLLIAELEDRISFMRRRYNLSNSQAKAAINARDRKRVNLYKKFGKVNYEHPAIYDMSLNMSRISMDKAVDLVCRMIAG